MIFFSMLVYNEGEVRLTRCTPPVVCDGLVALFHLLCVEADGMFDVAHHVVVFFFVANFLTRGFEIVLSSLLGACCLVLLEVSEGGLCSFESFTCSCEKVGSKLM